MAVARASALLALLRVAQVTAGPAPPAPADASRFVPPGPAAGEGGFLAPRAPVEHQVADNTSEEMHIVVADGMSEEGYPVVHNVSEEYWVADSVSEEFYSMAASDTPGEYHVADSVSDLSWCGATYPRGCAQACEGTIKPREWSEYYIHDGFFCTSENICRCYWKSISGAIMEQKGVDIGCKCDP
jgi:hypothetical protein